ncbi:release factor glutamine methyltransferase [Abditibacteriota bacterium]|nr:release factor glutamine methyltransferase [Abditibacteriota bacterium]
MTYLDWFQFAAHRLQTTLPHSSEARLLARRLLDHATGQNHAHLMSPETHLAGEVEAELNASLVRLGSGEPLPYVLGFAPFWNRDWQVRSGVLIPRPETELLVEAVLEHLTATKARVAELGTGSGIIAGTLALERPQWEMLATDVSPEARAVASDNFSRLGAHVQLLEGLPDNWLAPIKPFAPFDCIASNPPYIPSHEIERLQHSVRDFEPRLALDGGEDGLNPYRQIAASGRDLLAPGGFVALEVGWDQRQPIEELFHGWPHLEWKFDFQNIARTCIVWK